MAKILLVDDSVITLKKEKHEIELADKHECITAQDGLLALESLEQNKDIDLIITDIHMPNMDGLEFIEEVMKRGLNIPLIVCTADAQVSTARKATELGARLVVNKPDFFDPEKAEKIIQKVLGSKNE